MYEHDATEIAYKNGYEAGKRDTIKQIEANKRKVNEMLTCKKCNGTNLVMRRNAINPMHTELICEDCGVRVKFMNADEARLYETKREFNVEEFCRKVNDLGKAAINDEPPKPPIQVSMIFVRNMNCDRTTDVQLNEFLTSHPKYRVDKISFVSRAGDTCFERLFVVFSVYDI